MIFVSIFNLNAIYSKIYHFKIYYQIVLKGFNGIKKPPFQKHLQVNFCVIHLLLDNNLACLKVENFHLQHSHLYFRT